MLIPFKECIKIAQTDFKGVIHIGAHHGEEIKDYVDNGVKSILWVEANRIIMRDLYDNVKMYPVKNQFLNNVLASEDNKEVTFHITNNGQSSSIFPLETHKIYYPNIKVVRTEQLKARRFDSLCKEHLYTIDLDEFDFINIDVQGAELEVLKGFGNLFDRFNFKAIYCEVNLEPLYKGAALIGELDEFLSSVGYQRVITKLTEYNWGDALYLKGKR